jgi:hypothetical protein
MQIADIKMQIGGRMGEVRKQGESSFVAFVLSWPTLPPSGFEPGQGSETDAALLWCGRLQ